MDYDDGTMDYDFMICFLCINQCYCPDSPECAGLLIDLGCRWHWWTSLDSRSSQGVDYIWLGHFFYAYVICIQVYHDDIYG
jgi:hypothetical protein